MVEKMEVVMEIDELNEILHVSKLVTVGEDPTISEKVETQALELRIKLQLGSDEDIEPNVEEARSQRHSSTCMDRSHPTVIVDQLHWVPAIMIKILSVSGLALLCPFLATDQGGIGPSGAMTYMRTSSDLLYFLV
ncbi:hypothetical protein L2E82_05136 [Cichorium intybus]|uniref:Uncharacterized protein n=1 Tax=Cichorium intybus TaxID=13427 RepID=A0ACB9H7F7_CICIN|nr:hypothetical protein L2E82_05136 [Cichorium intybus]